MLKLKACIDIMSTEIIPDPRNILKYASAAHRLRIIFLFSSKDGNYRGLGCLVKCWREPVTWTLSGVVHKHVSKYYQTTHNSTYSG